MEVCGPKGRDCIERNSAKDFNCSTTCEGIYADVQWVGKKIGEEIEDEQAGETVFKGKDDEELSKMLKRIADLERKVKLVEGALGKEGEGLDKEKYKMLIAEYRKFKRENVRHFRFNAGESTRSFGNFLSYLY